MKPVPNETEIAAKGRQLEAERWELPQRYRLQSDLLALPPDELRKRDPDMAALWERVQADEKRLAEMATSPFGQISPPDAYRARAAQRAEELRATLYTIEQQIGAALTAGGQGNLEELHAARLALRHRRAEQLAVMGRYDLAASEEPDARYRDRYLAILDAVWREDGEWCECEDARGTGEHANLTVSRQHVQEEVFSIREGKMVFLLACTGCGGMNAIANLPDHLRQQRAHRARALQVAGNLPPTDAAQKLAERGLTTALLLKAE